MSTAEFYKDMIKFGLDEQVGSDYIDVREYGVLADGVQLDNVSVTTNFTSVQPITVAGANFTQEDVGKLAVLISSAQDMGNPVRPATITAVTSPTQITVTYATGYMSNFTGGTMIYGTNNFDALQNALNAAAETATSPAKTVYLPAGIMMARKSGFGLTVPDRVNVIGTGNTPLNIGHANIKWSGTTLVTLSGHPTTSAGLTVGSTADPLHRGGSTLQNFNVDGCGVVNTVLSSSNWSTRGFNLTIARGFFQGLSIGGSCVFKHCCVIMGAIGTPVKINPADATFDDNIVVGGGLNLPCIRCDGANSSISGNHLFRTQTVVGGGILLDVFGNGAEQGSFIVNRNRFDSLQGDAITVKVSGTNQKLHGAVISDNIGFTNDSVTNNTYSFVKLDVATGCQIRGLDVSDNVLQSSFVDPTKGIWKSLIDGAAVVGNAYGVTVSNNVADGITALYTSFTPAYTAGNITMQTGSNTVTIG